MKRRLRVYRSCYSCLAADVVVTANGKTVVCRDQNRLVKLKQGMTIPEWCRFRKEKTK